MCEMNDFIASGRELVKYLEDRGLRIEHTNAIDTPQNCIYLSNRTSFNWKSKNRIVRLNCKEEVNDTIERNTDLRAVSNGVGDTIRSWSFIIDNLNDLNKAIAAIMPMIQ